MFGASVCSHSALPLSVTSYFAGVILYALITGSLPFDDDCLPALLNKVAKGEYYSELCLCPCWDFDASV